MNETLILKGKPVADQNRQYCLNLIAQNELQPQLYVFLLGNDAASAYYVESIKKQSQKYHVTVTVAEYQDTEITEQQLIAKINELNNDPTVHGVMVQKPLPKHINTAVIENTISPNKDIDGFHALNAGLLLYEKECFLPCTAQAILEIMDFYEISAEGKHVVVVGRSSVVGKPIANLLLYKAKNRNATVTVCHSRTPDLAYFTKQADILITAVGIANLIKNDMLKEQVIILDAGINEISASTSPTQEGGESGGGKKIVGDVDFTDCFSKSSKITPVPGGVGSVTTSILFKHLCDSSKKIKKIVD